VIKAGRREGVTASSVQKEGLMMGGGGPGGEREQGGKVSEAGGGGEKRRSGVGRWKGRGRVRRAGAVE
jgi:hypothetical protein